VAHVERFGEGDGARSSLDSRAVPPGAPRTPEEVGCPICRAGEGQRCRSPRGLELAYAHLGRRRRLVTLGVHAARVDVHVERLAFAGLSPAQTRSVTSDALDAWVQKSVDVPRGASGYHPSDHDVQQGVLRSLFRAQESGNWNTEQAERGQQVIWSIQNAMYKSGRTPGHQLVGLYDLGVLSDHEVDALVWRLDPEFATWQRYRFPPEPVGATADRAALPGKCALATPSQSLDVWQVIRSAQEGAWKVKAHLREACPSVRTATSALSLRGAYSTYAPRFVAVDHVVTPVCGTCWQDMVRGRFKVRVAPDLV
jgi:hypothetical protein